MDEMFRSDLAALWTPPEWVRGEEGRVRTVM